MLDFALNNLLEYVYRCLTIGATEAYIGEIARYAEMARDAYYRGDNDMHCIDGQSCFVTPGSVLCTGVPARPPCPNWLPAPKACRSAKR